MGCVLVLLPKVNAYAAQFSMGGEGEEFIGITSMLEAAQIWKTKKQAQQAIVKYASLIEEQLQKLAEVNIDIRLLKRKSDGKLNCEGVETLLIKPGEFQNDS